LIEADKRFFKNISILSLGIAFAQIITLASYPFITRLYSPFDFGILAQFTAILSILIPLASFRYEIAIPLAKDKSEAFHIVTLGVLFTGLNALVIMIVVVFAGAQLATFFRRTDLIPFLALLPLAVTISSFFQLMNYWAIRQKRFDFLAKTKIGQTCGSIAVQIISGLLNPQPIGLILAIITSNLIGAGSVVMKMFHSDSPVVKSALFRIAQKYKRTAIVSTISGFINTLGYQLQFFLMAYFYGIKASGFLLLATNLLVAVDALIGYSVGQAYYSEAAARYRVNKSSLKPIFIKTSMLLLLIGSIIAVVIWMASPWAIPFIFGDNWLEAGLYIRYMSIYFLVNLICSPVSTTVFIVGKQQIQIIWDIFRLLMISLCFYIPSYMELKPLDAVIFYSIGSSTALTILFIYNLSLVFSAAKNE